MYLACLCLKCYVVVGTKDDPKFGWPFRLMDKNHTEKVCSVIYEGKLMLNYFVGKFAPCLLTDEKNCFNQWGGALHSKFGPFNCLFFFCFTAEIDL